MDAVLAFKFSVVVKSNDKCVCCVIRKRELSEYEVLGTSTNSNGYERDKQVQYSYYSAGNSKIKYNHGAISTAISYWTRSPSVNADACFMVVMGNGASLNYKADISSGFAPGFCV